MKKFLFHLFRSILTAQNIQENISYGFDEYIENGRYIECENL